MVKHGSIYLVVAMPSRMYYGSSYRARIERDAVQLATSPHTASQSSLFDPPRPSVSENTIWHYGQACGADAGLKCEIGDSGMNERFAGHVDRMPSLYRQLMESDALPLSTKAAWKKLGAIYVFFHDGKAEHVGRTRNLQGRIRGHLAASHFSASFAFKQARATMDKKATYKPEGSRANLFADPEFRAAFDAQRLRLKDMTMRYLAVPNAVDQYLLELYAAMELGLSLDEFDTH